MKKFTFALVLSGVAALGLAGCVGSAVTNDQIETKNAHYWQRAETSSSIWQRGPKAQQMLHRDISRCTTEVRELQRLGAIRANTPADPDASAKVANSSAARLAQWDTPERDGYLYAEHSDYHDFETCMQFSGWERIEYLPHDTATQARENYIRTIKAEQRQTNDGTVKPVPQNGSDDRVGKLNE